MKKLLSVLLAIVLLLSFSLSAITMVSAKDDPELTVSSATAVKGSEAEVVISLVNNPGLASLKLKVAFPSDLTFKSVVYNNAALGGQSQQPSKFSSPVTLNWFNGGANTNGDIWFAKLTFLVSENATEGDKTVAISYNQDDVYNIDMNDVVFAVENGKITVVDCLHEQTEIRNAKEASCTEAGYTGDTYCISCGKVLSIGQVITAPGHNYTAVVTECTCTENGYTTYTCSRCGDTYVADEVAAPGHDETDWIIDSKPALNKAGSKHKECKTCGEIIATEEIPAIDPNAPRIEFVSKKARKGKSVDVQVVLKNNPGITSLKLKLNYSDDLTLTNIAYNTDIGGQSQLPQQLDSPVLLNWFNGAANLDGDFVLATLTFAISEDATEGLKDLGATYDPEDVFNIDDVNVEFAILGDDVEVISYIPGDINGDGKVNNKDLTRLFQYLSEWNVEVDEAALDVNGDGKVNNKDLTRLFQYLSEWNVEIF